MCIRPWYWLGNKVQDGALDQAHQQHESYFNLLLNFCCLAKQRTFQMAAPEITERHPGVSQIGWAPENSGCCLFTSARGGQDMKMLLIPEI